MPLPQLKKEIFEKAKVDFHIYTADRFLEYFGNKSINKNMIDEVRQIRELEEKRIIMNRREMMERDIELHPRIFEKYSIEYIHLFEKLERIFMEMDHSKIHQKYSEELEHMFHRLKISRNRIIHGDIDRKLLHRMHIDIKEFIYFFDKILQSEDDINPKLSMRLREFIDRLEYLNHKIIY